MRDAGCCKETTALTLTSRLLLLAVLVLPAGWLAYDSGDGTVAGLAAALAVVLVPLGRSCFPGRRPAELPLLASLLAGGLAAALLLPWLPPFLAVPLLLAVSAAATVASWDLLPETAPSRAWLWHAAFGAEIGLLVLSASLWDGRWTWLVRTLSELGGDTPSRPLFVVLLFVSAGCVAALSSLNWRLGAGGFFLRGWGAALAAAEWSALLLLLATGLTRVDSTLTGEMVAHHFIASGFAIAFGLLMMGGWWLFPHASRAFRTLPGLGAVAIFLAWATNVPYLAALADKPTVCILYVETPAFAWIVCWGAWMAIEIGRWRASVLSSGS